VSAALLFNGTAEAALLRLVSGANASDVTTCGPMVDGGSVVCASSITRQNNVIGNGAEFEYPETADLPGGSRRGRHGFSTTSAGSVDLPRLNADNLNSGKASIAFALLTSHSCPGTSKIQDCISSTATDYVLFGLDDSGAGTNDHHDDRRRVAA